MSVFRCLKTNNYESYELYKKISNNTLLAAGLVAAMTSCNKDMKD
jgi:hypothetical protein